MASNTEETIPPEAEEVIKNTIIFGMNNVQLIGSGIILAIVFICGYLVYDTTKKGKKADMIDQFEVDKYSHMKLPPLAIKFDELKANTERQLEEGKIPKEEAARRIHELIRMRALQMVPLIELVEKESRQVESLYKKSMIAGNQYNAFAGLKEMVDGEIESVKYEASQIHPQFGQQIWPHAFQIHRSKKELLPELSLRYGEFKTALNLKLKNEEISKEDYVKKWQELIMNRAIKIVPLVNSVNERGQMFKKMQEQKQDIKKEAFIEFQNYKMIIEEDMKSIHVEAAQINPEFAKAIMPNAMRLYAEFQKNAAKAPGQTVPIVTIERKNEQGQVQGGFEEAFRKKKLQEQKDLQNRKKMAEESERAKADRLAKQLMEEEEAEKSKKKTK